MIKNKEIQEKRMREYFIQATSDILKGEGIRAVSVRSIADRAGYSYATMYNYFKDANELIFLCVNDFQQECKAFVAEEAKKSPRGKERLKASVLAYIHYFTEYPGIFELFYLAKLSDFGSKQTTIQVISNSLDSVCEQEWNYCISHKLYKVEDVEMMRGLLRHLVVGMLLLYMNRMIPATYPAFVNQVSTQVDHLLEINSKSPKTGG